MDVKKKGRPRTNDEAFMRIVRAGNKKTVVKKKEWKLATPPGAHILRKYLKREYKVETLADDSGWLITRV
jgi:hypothetical protein